MQAQPCKLIVKALCLIISVREWAQKVQKCYLGMVDREAKSEMDL
jgi:hypothetical protein